MKPPGICPYPPLTFCCVPMAPCWERSGKIRARHRTACYFSIPARDRESAGRNGRTFEIPSLLSLQGRGITHLGSHLARRIVFLSGRVTVFSVSRLLSLRLRRKAQLKSSIILKANEEEISVHTSRYL